MIDKKNITGIILAGGKSSRMGTDKGFLTLNGKPFAQYSIDALTPLVSDLIIVSNHKEYDIFGLKRIEDDLKDAGPLSGLYSGLNYSKTQYNLVLSCDIPFIKTSILKKLIHVIDDDSEVIQIESQGKSMPLIAIYKKQCRHIFYNLLNQGERRLRIAVKLCKVKHITLDSEDYKVAMNINTKEDFKAIKNANNY